MNVLVAGGAGYIGSHTVKALQKAGHAPVIYDNAGRGHKAVERLTGAPAVWADLNDGPALDRALRHHRIDCVMHFAAYAYVGESVHEPLMYYANNVATTISVLQRMAPAHIGRDLLRQHLRQPIDADRAAGRVLGDPHGGILRRPIHDRRTGPDHTPNAGLGRCGQQAAEAQDVHGERALRVVLARSR